MSLRVFIIQTNDSSVYDYPGAFSESFFQNRHNIIESFSKVTSCEMVFCQESENLVSYWSTEHFLGCLVEAVKYCFMEFFEGCSAQVSGSATAEAAGL